MNVQKFVGFQNHTPLIKTRRRELRLRKTKSGSDDSVFWRVSEETTHPQRSLVGLFPYNSEKLGDSMIDRP
jgi:hypothetical protein